VVTPAERLPDLTADAERVAREALAEDGPRDLSTTVSLPAPLATRALLECRGRVVAAGLRYADAAARLTGLDVVWTVAEGAVVERGGVLGELRGGLAGILTAERPLLNLLQRAAGIATLTRAYVDAVAGSGCRILHTRKTAPGLRWFDVSAVVAGGGGVHRLDLAHTVMIKDNHWTALRLAGRSLREALASARALGAVACQVEVETEPAVREACAAGADRLLVDNQLPDTVRSWGAIARELRPGIEIEASGGVTLDTVRAYAEAGADYVSVGALTHSVPAVDVALRVLSAES
jgi:nicotinate-nucleotide pyrophosphorylase (carboxylating)